MYPWISFQSQLRIHEVRLLSFSFCCVWVLLTTEQLSLEKTAARHSPPAPLPSTEMAVRGKKPNNGKVTVTSIF